MSNKVQIDRIWKLEVGSCCGKLVPQQPGRSDPLVRVCTSKLVRGFNSYLEVWTSYHLKPGRVPIIEFNGGPISHGMDGTKTHPTVNSREATMPWRWICSYCRPSSGGFLKVHRRRHEMLPVKKLLADCSRREHFP